MVFFLGVLYHAPDPLGYLKRIHSITEGMAIIETHADMFDVDVPAIAYYPGDTLNGDASNHFAPNIPALRGLLSDAGCSRVEVFHPWVNQQVWAVQLGREPTSLRERLRQRFGRPRCGRVVAHAYP